jgi:hypothetical protein
MKLNYNNLSLPTQQWPEYKNVDTDTEQQKTSPNANIDINHRKSHSLLDECRINDFRRQFGSFIQRSK